MTYKPAAARHSTMDVKKTWSAWPAVRQNALFGFKHRDTNFFTVLYRRTGIASEPKSNKNEKIFLRNLTKGHEP